MTEETPMILKYLYSAYAKSSDATVCRAAWGQMQSLSKFCVSLREFRSRNKEIHFV